MAIVCAGLTTGSGYTSTLPAFALVGSANKRLKIREITVFNTGAAAVAIKGCRLSSAGTPGTAATNDRQSDPEESQTLVGALRGTYTSTAPTTVEGGKRLLVGAGSGIVLGFPNGWAVPAVANAGIGFLLDTGTAQALTVDVTWEE